MTREGLAGDMSLRLEPLQTTEAHAYWRVFLSGRTDLPTGDLKVHMDRFLALPPEEQRSHFSVKRTGTSLPSRPSAFGACSPGCGWRPPPRSRPRARV